MNKFDWKSFSFKMLSLAPVIVAGVEQLHSAANGATKAQLAQGSLLLAAGVADATLPDDQKKIADAVAPVAANLISSIVDLLNATGVFQHKLPGTAPIEPAPGGIIAGN
jgi:hypothetical protein